MSDWFFIILVFALLIYIAWKDIVFRRERQDLLNRIMARNYIEYCNTKQDNPLPKSGNVIKKALSTYFNSLTEKEGEND